MRPNASDFIGLCRGLALARPRPQKELAPNPSSRHSEGVGRPTRLVGTVVALAVTALPGLARGQTIDITLNENTQRLLSQELGLTPDAVTPLIREQILALYGLANVPEFVRLSANAQNLSNKGLGVDYASHPDSFVFGLAINAATDAGRSDLEALSNVNPENIERAIPVGSAQVSLMAGYNLQRFDLPQWTLFANALYYPLSVSQLKGTFSNFGLHAQYRPFEPMGTSTLVQWGGIALTSGLELSRMSLSLEGTFNTESPVGQGIDLLTRSTGRLKLTQSALTIPLEVTTDVRFLYLFSLYAGFGIDIPLGKATTDLDLQSSLSVNNLESLGISELGTAIISAQESGGADSVLFRVLGGLQLHLGPVKIFTQVNLLTRDLTVGVAAGLRVVL